MRRIPIQWWNPLTASLPGRRRETFARPELECLEDRIVPAHNLAIDYVDTSGVSQTNDYDYYIRTFTATADDAVLNVADIQAAFDAGFDVVISTGEGGGSTGNIVWREGADAYFTSAADYPPFHSLTLQTDSLDTGRNVEIQAGLHGFLSDQSPLATLSILTGGSGGAVTLHQVDVAFGSIAVTAGDAGIFLYGNLTTNGGDVTLTGNVFLAGYVEINTLAVEFDGGGEASVSSASASFLSGGSVTVSGTIDGDDDMRDLRIFANAVSLGGDVGTTRHKLSSIEVTGNMFLVANRAISVQSQFTLVQGTLDLNSQELTVSGQFSIGNGSTVDWATISGNGTIHADTTIQVASNGVISPGSLRNLGMLEIDGGIEFLAGSHFAVDLGDTPDLLHVTGAAQLDPGAMLVGASGVLNGAGPFQILTADGGLTGKFALPDSPIGLAEDLVQVSYTGTAVQVQRATIAATRVAGVTSDGTLYTIALTGGGNARLQVFESFKLGSAVVYATEFRT